MNILRIDTSDNLKTKIELILSGKSIFLEEERAKPGDQNVLTMIEALLQDNKITLKDLNSIEVKTGPGSFTGLRVGVSIANALSFALGIPVNNKEPGEIVIPEY